MDDAGSVGNDAGLDFNDEADDLFAIPPPLNESLLLDDPANIVGQDLLQNPEDNVDGDPVQGNEEKKKKRAFKPRVNLNEQRLCSKKGIETLKNLCSDETFKGKGHEVSDLNKLLYRFEHWAQCLMPRWPFDNVVQKCEILGGKSMVKNELKRVRRSDEEVLRGEPDDEAAGADEPGQVETTNEENSNEATTQQDTAQEERPPVELTEEQRERIRRNRELAFERREAKRKRLEEESQTLLESQTEDLTDAEQSVNIENSSENFPGLVTSENEPNVTSEDAELEAEETSKDTVPDQIEEDIATNVEQNGSTYNPHNEAGVLDIDHNIERPLDTTERIVSYQQSNTDSEKEQEIDADMSDDDEILNRSALDTTERIVSSQQSNTNSEKEQEIDDGMSDDDDDEILNRSAFELNPSRQEAPSNVDQNNELSINSKDDEVPQDNPHQSDDEEVRPLPENEILQNDSTTSENATAQGSMSSQETKIPEELPSSQTTENIDGASEELMDVDSSTTE